MGNFPTNFLFTFHNFFTISRIHSSLRSVWWKFNQKKISQLSQSEDSPSTLQQPRTFYGKLSWLEFFFSFSQWQKEIFLFIFSFSLLCVKNFPSAFSLLLWWWLRTREKIACILLNFPLSLSRIFLSRRENHHTGRLLRGGRKSRTCGKFFRLHTAERLRIFSMTTTLSENDFFLPNLRKVFVSLETSLQLHKKAPLSLFFALSHSPTTQHTDFLTCCIASLMNDKNIPFMEWTHARNCVKVLRELFL